MVCCLCYPLSLFRKGSKNKTNCQVRKFQEEVKRITANTAIQVGTENLRAGRSEMKCGASSMPKHLRNLKWGSQIMSKGGERKFKPKLQASWLVGQDAQGPCGGKPRSPHWAVLSSSTSDAPARLFTPCLRLGGLNLLFFSLQVIGRQSRRGCGTIPAVSAADGANSMGTAVVHMERLEGARAPWPIRRELLQTHTSQGLSEIRAHYILLSSGRRMKGIWRLFIFVMRKQEIVHKAINISRASDDIMNSCKYFTTDLRWWTGNSQELWVCFILLLQ